MIWDIFYTILACFVQYKLDFSNPCCRGREVSNGVCRSRSCLHNSMRVGHRSMIAGVPANQLPLLPWNSGSPPPLFVTHPFCGVHVAFTPLNNTPLYRAKIFRILDSHPPLTRKLFSTSFRIPPLYCQNISRRFLLLACCDPQSLLKRFLSVNQCTASGTVDSWASRNSLFVKHVFSPRQPCVYLYFRLKSQVQRASRLY